MGLVLAWSKQMVVERVGEENPFFATLGKVSWWVGKHWV